MSTRTENVRENRALMRVMQGKWLMENKRPAEAVPLLERASQECRSMGFREVMYRGDLQLLEALYTLRQRDRLLDTLQSIIRWWVRWLMLWPSLSPLRRRRHHHHIITTTVITHGTTTSLSRPVLGRYERRVAQGSCSQRDVAEIKTALAGCVDGVIQGGVDPDPGVMGMLLSLAEEAEKGESWLGTRPFLGLFLLSS
jgi:hypothetical protein